MFPMSRDITPLAPHNSCLIRFHGVSWGIYNPRSTWFTRFPRRTVVSQPETPTIHDNSRALTGLQMARCTADLLIRHDGRGGQPGGLQRACLDPLDHQQAQLGSNVH